MGLLSSPDIRGRGAAPRLAKRLSILHPPGVLASKVNPFGKDVANAELWRALARHGGYEQLDVLSFRTADEAVLADALLGEHRGATRIVSGTVLNTQLPSESGALLRGQPYLDELAWLRRRQAGDRAYSLLGLVHTIAPPAIRQMMAMASVAPVQPWDALICTSPAVREALGRMFDDWGQHLAERTGGSPPPRPALPVVQLGVDGPAFAALADRPEARARRRVELGLAEADVLVLWVGRLSFFEKAYPQPMFRALQRAVEAAGTGAKLQFVMAGWFPAERDRALYEAAAKALAPDVDIRFLDGNDRTLLEELWAAADIFLSLVDNIQETFGITPLEAMAAGLPVVASDWDGYRYTMRHGEEAFLIPTLGGSSGGLGAAMVQRHALEVDSYQTYVGEVAQFTAVHIGRAAEALIELIRSPDLRRRMGAAGRRRIAEMFDWPVVVGRYNALLEELAAMRAAAPEPTGRRTGNPVKGDPFADFAGFATEVGRLDLPLRATAGLTAQDVLRTGAVELDQAFGYWRADLSECAEAFTLVAEGRAASVREVLLAFPQARRRAVELGLHWLAKHGFLDWLS